MKTNHHKLFIILIIVTIFSGAYIYFYQNLDTEAATTDAPLSSSLDTTVDQGVASDTNTTKNSIDSDTAFISSLLSLRTINIDASLFDNNAFKSLKDNSRSTEFQSFVVPGRTNPFAPVGTN